MRGRGETEKRREGVGMEGERERTKQTDRRTMIP